MKTRKILVSMLAMLTIGVGMASMTACDMNSSFTPMDSNSSFNENDWSIEAVYARAQELGYEGSLEDFLKTVKGADGVGITDIYINDNGELIVHLSNGAIKNLGKIVREEIEKCVHDYSVVYAEIEADCFNGREGSKIMGCSKCGDSIEIYTGYAHDFGEASCIDPATCLICGENKDLKLAAHTWVEATCTTDEYCSVCNERGQTLASGHTMVAETCTEDAYCANCDYVYAGTAHGLTSAFGTLVEAGTWTSFDNAVDENGYYYIAPVDCFTEGYAPFDFCRICLEEAVSFDNLEWAVFNRMERTNAEKMAYLFGSGLVYTEGYKVIASAHRMINYWGTQEEVYAGMALYVAMPNERGEYIEATCTTGAVQNFQVCKVCLEYYRLDAGEAFNLNNLKAMFTGENAVVSTFVEGEPLGHTYINPMTGENTYSAGVAPTCTTTGYTESYKCWGCNLIEIEKVLPAAGHLWNETTGKCERDFCGEVCEHLYYKDGVCTVCGKQE